METKVPKGKYVLAVSGGVDSMTLLHVLSQQSDVELVVAHFNHGIRSDSEKDEEMVKNTANSYGLPFEIGYGKLGSSASEEKAREARYKFLKSIKNKYKADKIIAAHHQDDLIETAVLNILRGTGRRGLTSISQNPETLRPLLGVSKKEILIYAKRNNLEWREDPSNQDDKYLRNYIRHRILPKLTSVQRRKLLYNLNRMSLSNKLIDNEIEELTQAMTNKNRLKRASFIASPSEISNEVLMHFLHRNNIRNFDKKTIERLTVAVKTGKSGTKHEVNRGNMIELSASEALLRTGVNS